MERGGPKQGRVQVVVAKRERKSRQGRLPGRSKGVRTGRNLKVLEENDHLYCFAAYHPDDPDAVRNIEIVIAHPRILGVKLQLLGHEGQHIIPAGEVEVAS